MPSGLITGGTTGIAIAVNHYTKLPISSIVLVFNVIMFMIGLFVLGKKIRVNYTDQYIILSIIFGSTAKTVR